MSPEQVEGRPIDTRSDIFSLGTVFYEMAAGKNPHKADSAASTMYNVVEVTPAPISVLRSELPEQFEDITLRCLSKKPASRYRDAGDLLTDLINLKKSAL
jgi:serine/threonine-protein kinase